MLVVWLMFVTRICSESISISALVWPPIEAPLGGPIGSPALVYVKDARLEVIALVNVTFGVICRADVSVFASTSSNVMSTWVLQPSLARPS